MANLNATLTCPYCGHHAHEGMPTDRCVVVYDCPACAPNAEAKEGRLLCVLLLRGSSVPLDPGRRVLKTGTPGELGIATGVSLPGDCRPTVVGPIEPTGEPRDAYAHPRRAAGDISASDRS
jgi:hypothetical protein